MLGSMISGIILSRYVFKSIRIMGVAVLMENVHMICAYWGFVMMALHLGFHWNMYQTKNRFIYDSKKPFCIF